MDARPLALRNIPTEAQRGDGENAGPAAVVEHALAAAHLVLDGAQLVAIVWLALRANRIWPLFAAAAALSWARRRFAAERRTAAQAGMAAAAAAWCPSACPRSACGTRCSATCAASSASNQLFASVCGNSQGSSSWKSIS